MHALLNVALPVFGIILAGYLVGRLRLLEGPTSRRAPYWSSRRARGRPTRWWSHQRSGFGLPRPDLVRPAGRRGGACALFGLG